LFLPLLAFQQKRKKTMQKATLTYTKMIRLNTESDIIGRPPRWIEN
jgi:hypothetical protein